MIFFFLWSFVFQVAYLHTIDVYVGLFGREIFSYGLHVDGGSYLQPGGIHKGPTFGGSP